MKKLLPITLLTLILTNNIYADKIDDFVDRFYVEVLDRTADADGHDYWSNELRNGTAAGSDLARGFIFSNEYKKKDVDNDSYVRTLYKAFFNREPDTAGYDYWMEQLNKNHAPLDAVLNGFLGSSEFKDLSNSYGITPIHEEETHKGDSEGEDDNEGEGEGEGEGEDDNGGEGENGGSHNQGQSCAKCHTNDFNSGATVFKTLHAATNTLGATGYKIQLGDTDVYNAGRGDGNSYLTRFTGNKFTAHVIDSNGNIVNSSASLSHDSTRLDCNRCHTVNGANGAPGRITSTPIQSTTTTTTTTTSTTFSSNVMSILNTKCKSCHGSNGRFTITTANATYSNISALKGSASAGGQYLLNKGSNTVSHGGGKVISTGSAEYTTIKAWVDASAPNN